MQCSKLAVSEEILKIFKIPVIQKVLDDIKKKTDLLTGAVMDDPVIHARTKGVGILTKQDIIDYGAVGPTARASGVAIDVRKDDPYAAYPLVNWKVITAKQVMFLQKQKSGYLRCTNRFQ